MSREARARASPLPLGQGAIEQELNQQARTNARGPLRQIGPFALAPIRAGNIQMDPGTIAHKLAQE